MTFFKSICSTLRHCVFNFGMLWLMKVSTAALVTWSSKAKGGHFGVRRDDSQYHSEWRSISVNAPMASTNIKSVKFWDTLCFSDNRGTFDKSYRADTRGDAYLPNFARDPHWFSTPECQNQTSAKYIKTRGKLGTSGSAHAAAVLLNIDWEEVCVFAETNVTVARHAGLERRCLQTPDFCNGAFPDDSHPERIVESSRFIIWLMLNLHLSVLPVYLSCS